MRVAELVESKSAGKANVCRVWSWCPIFRPNRINILQVVGKGPRVVKPPVSTLGEDVYVRLGQLSAERPLRRPVHA